MPTNEPLAEAQAALLGKANKLEVARQAILTQDLSELAKADREKVRRLEEKRVFGQEKPPVSGEDVGDIIVCDDYRRNDAPRPAPSRAWPLAAGIALAGGMIAAAALAPRWMDRPVQPTPTQVQPQQSITTTKIEKKGFIIDLPGAESK